MRIISRFHDYYDVVQAHGADDGLLMLRETDEYEGEELKPFTPMLAHLAPAFTVWTIDRDRDRTFTGTRKWSALSVATGIIVFVGRPYVYFRTSRTLKELPYTEEVRFIYDLDELNALLMEHGSKSLYERAKAYKWSRPTKHWALIATQCAASKAFGELASELKAPIIHVTRNCSRVVTYPVLKDLHFYKVMPPWQAYQELSMFLGNIAAPDRVPVTIADKDRINQYGFDQKYGFRTRPKD